MKGLTTSIESEIWRRPVRDAIWESKNPRANPDGIHDGKERSGLVGEDFLLEIGTEEIPAAFLPRTIEDLREKAEQLFEVNRLRYETVETLATPRRLTLLVRGLEEQQGDSVQEISGPPRSVAFDEEGSPTKVLEKFCTKHGVTPAQTSIVEKPKGEYVFLHKVEAGKKAVEVLPEILPPWIVDLPFPSPCDGGLRTFDSPVRSGG